MASTRSVVKFFSVFFSFALFSQFQPNVEVTFFISFLFCAVGSGFGCSIKRVLYSFDGISGLSVFCIYNLHSVDNQVGQCCLCVLYNRNDGDNKVSPVTTNTTSSSSFIFFI